MQKGGGGVDLTTASGQSEFGVSYSKSSGIGFNVTQKNKDVRTTISSDGSFSYAFSKENSNVQYRGKLGISSVNINVSGVFSATTSGSAISIPIYCLTLSFGHYRTRFRKYDQTGAYGYIHLPEMREYNSDEIYPSSKDEIYTDLRCKYRFTRSNAHWKHPTVGDFHTQNYEELTDSSYSGLASYNSDYAAAQYDGYIVSAQGLSGIVKPIHKYRGWVKPFDEAAYQDLGNEKRFLGYRTLLRLLNHIDTSDPEYSEWSDHVNMLRLHNNISYPRSWIALDPANDCNMRFVGDQGAHYKVALYDMFSNDLWAYGNDGEIVSPYYQQLNEQINRSKRVKYFLDSDEKIERIEVIKEDGIKYIFGVIKHPQELNNNISMPFWGAAPKIIREEVSTIIRDKDNLDEYLSKATNQKEEPFAYAWYLASVESPDYYDVGENSYTPDDHGSYIAFKYKLVSGNYAWVSPWDEDYMFTGVQGHDESENIYQHHEGIKEIWHPYLAETKTHVAFFQMTERSDAKNTKTGIVITEKRKLYPYDDPLHETEIEYFVKDEHSGSIIPVEMSINQMTGVPVENNMICVHGYHVVIPDGRLAFVTPLRIQNLTLQPNSSVPVITYLLLGWQQPPQWQLIQGDIYYHGEIGNTGLSLFTCAGSLPYDYLGSMEIDCEGPDGPMKLDAIKLYSRDVYEKLFSEAVVGNLVDPGFLDNNSDYISMTKFNYDYSLGSGTPNFYNTSGVAPGRLTLKGVSYYSKHNIKATPGFSFTYYDDDRIEYSDYYLRDPWGYYSSKSIKNVSVVDTELLSDSDSGDTFVPQAIWSLKTIVTPTGSSIKVVYDQDRYNYVQNIPAVSFPGDLSGREWEFADKAWLTAETTVFADDTLYEYEVVKQQFIDRPISTESNFPEVNERNDFVMLSLEIGNELVNPYPDPGQLALPNTQTSTFFFRLGVEIGADNFYHFVDSPELYSLISYIHHKRDYFIENTEVSIVMTVQPILRDIEWLEWSAGAFFEAFYNTEPEHEPYDTETARSNFIALKNNSAYPFTVNSDQELNNYVLVKTIAVGTDTERYFVLAIESDETDHYWFSDTYRLDDFISYVLDADVALYGSRIQMKRIPKYNGFPKQKYSTTDGMVGRYGGGLRVKSLELSDNYQNSTHAIKYFYTDPDSWINGDPTCAQAFESGSIFVDPPLTVRGYSGGDKRILRSEMYPYQNMLGSEVFYEFVTTMESQDNSNESGLEIYQFIVPKDSRIHSPFTSEQIDIGNIDPRLVTRSTELIRENSFPDSPQISGTFGYYKYSGNSDGGSWNLRPGTEERTFIFKRDERKVLLNNTALVGQPASIKTFDNSNSNSFQLVNERFFEYTSNFRFDGDNLPLLRHFTVSDGTLSEADYNTNILQPLGVEIDKHQAILLGIQSNNYKMKVLLIDEIYNTWRKTDVTMRQRHALNGDTQVLESHQKTLLYDFHTGLPILSQSTITGWNSSGNSAANFIYSLSVPNHGFNDSLITNSQFKRNMLIQKGYKLSAMSSMDFSNNSEDSPVHSGMTNQQILTLNNGIFDLLSAPETSVTSAERTHWIFRNFNDEAGNIINPDIGAWVPDATFYYVHGDNAKTSTGWRHLALQPENEDSHLLQLKQPEVSGGHWEAPGQNTIYDNELNVLEYRSRDNQFSTAKCIHNGQYVAANFANAQYSQVYYQGFEDEDGNSTFPGSSPYPNENFKDGQYVDEVGSQSSKLTAAEYLAQFQHVYVGSKARLGGYTLPADLNLQDAYPGISEDGRSSCWLSFYVFAGSDHENPLVPTVDIPGFHIVDVTSDLQTTDRVIQRVDNGWVLVRQKYSNSQILNGGSISLNGQGGIIDEITIYPAATSDISPLANNYRSDATCTIFGYHPHHKQVTSITDVRGRTVRFEYDERGQLFRTYDTNGKLKTEHYKSYQSEPLRGIEVENE